MKKRKKKREKKSKGDILSGKSYDRLYDVWLLASQVFANNITPWRIRVSPLGPLLHKIALICTCIWYHKGVKYHFELTMFVNNYNNHDCNRKRGIIKDLFFGVSKCYLSHIFCSVIATIITLFSFDFLVPSWWLHSTLLQPKCDLQYPIFVFIASFYSYFISLWFI